MDNKISEYVLKHSRKKDKELKYDFMPSLLEIIERPAHKGGTVIIFGVFTLLIAAIIWACFSEIDVVITASGGIQPKGHINVVRSYVSGTVDDISVGEGEYVNKGDLLITLDTEALEIDADRLNEQKKLLQTRKDIYTKIKNGEDISELSVSSYSIELQSSVQAILDENTSYLNTISGLENEKANAELNKQIAQIQIEEYNENGMTRQAQAQDVIIQQYDITIEQADLQESDTHTRYSAQINSNLAEIDAQLYDIDTELERYELAKKYQQITAPVSGYVNSVNINTTGDTVSSAQELVSIVPDGKPLEMVCYIRNMDIADIELGMEAEIKLEAYPYNKFGTVKGVVSYISPSAFSDERLGSVYLVKIQLENVNKEISIISGLSGSVEIKVDKRTVMDYFLEPILKGFGESLKEK